MPSTPSSPTATPGAGPTSAFLSLVRERQSCRAYNPNRPVPPNVLTECIEAGRLEPSACNKQPWRFVVTTDPERRAALCKVGLLPGIRHDWVLTAPVIVALCAEREWVTHRAAPAVSGIPYWLVDVGIAGEHFVLAATERGLGTCWIGWIREKGIRRILGAPRSIRVAALITVGYPAEPAGSPRPRKPLAEIAFSERWGEPFSPGE